MVNERLESALAWCKKNNIGSDRINLFDRYHKSKLSKLKNKGTVSNDNSLKKGTKHSGG